MIGFSMLQISKYPQNIKGFYEDHYVLSISFVCLAYKRLHQFYKCVIFHIIGSTWLWAYINFTLYYHFDNISNILKR